MAQLLRYNSDSAYGWYCYQDTLPNGLSILLEFYGHKDVKSRPKDSVAYQITLEVASKKKHLTNTYGDVTGRGGLDVYLWTAEHLEAFCELQKGKGPARLYAIGANKRLMDAYKKVLPRLGFSYNYRGESVMERIIE